MKAAFAAVCALLVAGCASAPVVVPSVDRLFADELFPPRSEVIDTNIFALSPAMRTYRDGRLANYVVRSGPRYGLFEAIRDELHIEYDTTMTRTAAETFDARSGNCLSLVILTAAFAKQMSIPIEYQSVFGYDTWSRSGDIAIRSGHANIVLGWAGVSGPAGRDREPRLTIDFLSSEVVQRQVARPISEETVVAMYLNNRAAELLAGGEVTRAYWWAREALRISPVFTSAYNTLAVIYNRHGNLAQAERALQVAIEREPGNTVALSNLASVFRQQGREAEAAVLQARVEELEPYPPYYYFDQGMQALARDEFLAAIDDFKKELERMPYDDEIPFALAVASLHVGATRQARRYLAQAIENSTTKGHRDIYAAKLAHLEAARPIRN